MKTDTTQLLAIRQNGCEMRAGQEPFPAPIGKLLGFTIVRDEKGRAAIEFEATENHANPMGTLHGGVLCDLADAAMGVAYRSTLAPGESFTTLDENQFPAAGLEIQTPGRGPSRSNREHRRFGRVRHFRSA